MAGLKRRRIGTRLTLILAVLAVALLDSASGDSADNEGTSGPIPPSVFISEPEDRSFVSSSSFEIRGGLGGSVQDIEVFMDGESLGPARRIEGEPGRWRVPAGLVSVTPGIHRISAQALGEAGRASAGVWIYYDTAGEPFVIALEPAQSTYQQGDTAIADDPDVLLFGPPDGDLILDMSTPATPPQIRASINERLSTGSIATLDLDIRDDVPGEYPVVVRAVADDGTAREATHTITIVGDADKVLFDDFEGADLWSASMSGTNGATDSAAIQGGGGNPGGYRQMQHELPGTADGEGNPTQITVVHLFEGGTWDPAVDGALSHINYSEDRIEQDPPFDGAAVGALVILEQDGTRYFVSLDEGNAFTNTAWETRSRRLTAGDFEPSAPDFSAGGGEMVFGILRSNTNRGNAEIVVTHGLDNWTVELFGE